MTILDEIAAKTKERIEERKRLCPDPLMVLGGEAVLRRQDQISGIDTMGAFPFEAALRKSGLSFITEVKKASPSKGLIAPDFPYEKIAVDYEAAGADAISCLTEPFYFQGQDAYLTAIRRATNIPILRKDFTIDEYMIYEAKALGANAVLLICSILDDAELKAFHQLADELNLSALVEAHSAEEIERAAKIGARIIGVNNRNLKDFTVDVQNAAALRNLAPEQALFVSESGVASHEDILAAERIHSDAVLVGEALMRSDCKFRTLQELSGRSPRTKICGLMTLEDVRHINQLPVSYAGFVFAPTRHQISRETAAALKAKLRPDIRAVGVFVDEDPEVVISYLNQGIIDMAQLHGNETDETIRLIRSRTKKPVIKAVILKDPNEAASMNAYPSADYLLFDAGRGSGQTFNWHLLEHYHDKPFFLAGGLQPENVTEAVRIAHPFAVDVSSGVENPDCSKNMTRMQRFTAAVTEV